MGIEPPFEVGMEISCFFFRKQICRITAQDFVLDEFLTRGNNDPWSSKPIEPMPVRNPQRPSAGIFRCPKHCDSRVSPPVWRRTIIIDIGHGVVDGVLCRLVIILGQEFHPILVIINDTAGVLILDVRVKIKSQVDASIAIRTVVDHICQKEQNIFGM